MSVFFFKVGQDDLHIKYVWLSNLKFFFLNAVLSVKHR